MTAPLSVRFPREVLSRLRQRARATAGTTPSGLAQRLVDEGLRMADHPGVVFKDGPSGRRAAIAYGPDIWEIVKALTEVDERGPAAVPAVAEILALSEAGVRTAMRYYSAYSDEINEEVAAADAASVAAEAAWIAEQRLLT